MEIVTDTAASAYSEVLATLGRAPKTQSRLGKTRELLGFQVVVTDPNREIIRCPTRRFNYRYMLAETMWHLQDRDDIEWLTRVHPGIRQFVRDQADEDQDRVAWAYGPYVHKQLLPALGMLGGYKGTRQAVITIPADPRMASGTPPCPSVVQFLERQGELRCFVYMRSNDAYMGFPYDLFMFMTWQKAFANALNLDMGPYHHYAASMHLYEKHEELARQTWQSGPWASSLDWRPRMDEVANGDLNHAMGVVSSGQGYDGMAAPSWAPGLFALDGNYELMDLSLQEIREAGEGLGWKQRTTKGTGRAETPETETADRGGEEEESEAPATEPGTEASS